MSHSKNSHKGTKHSHLRELWSRRASLAHIVGYLRNKSNKILSHRAERRLAKKEIDKQIEET